MPLLDIKITNHVTITSKIEESTAKMVNLYVEFTGASADAVVNDMLAYVGKHDKEFQRYVRERGNANVEPALKIKKAVPAPKTARAPRKPQLVAAQ